MQIFSKYLTEKSADSELCGVLTDLTLCFKEIADTLRAGIEGYAGGENVYGDKQVKLDLLSNEILVKRLKGSGRVGFIGSEELEEPYLDDEMGEGDGFSVVFDPLDGSSIVDTNLSVGTIVGIFKGKGVIGKTGRDQVASIIAVYGPRLTFMITLGVGVDEFIFDYEKNEFVLYHQGLKISEEGKIFMPGNTAATLSGKWYMDLVEYWFKNGYKLRYSGGMVPDINQILKKGGGVFAYPGSKEFPNGKLRLLYECAPVAMIIEQAGGSASTFPQGDYRLMDVMDIKIETVHQQVPAVFGSKKEVERAVSKCE